MVKYTKNKLKMINVNQKHALRIIFNEDRLYHSLLTTTFKNFKCIKCLSAEYISKS